MVKSKRLEMRVLERIAPLPTASFCEEHVFRAIEGIVREEFSDSDKITVSRDPIGNLVVHYAGTENRRKPLNMAFVAHTDHPAFHLEALANGLYHAKMMGGFNPLLLPGSKIDFHNHDTGDTFINEGTIIGPIDQGENNPSSRFLVIPAKPKKDEGSSHYRLFGTLKLPKMRVTNGIIKAPVLDDYAGIAMQLGALFQVERGNIPVDLYLVFHRAEEVGFIGAQSASRDRILPKGIFVYSVETSSYLAKRTPDGKPEQIALVGGGPIIRTGDKTVVGFDPEAYVVAHLAGLQQQSRGRLVQEQRMYGGSCEEFPYYARRGKQGKVTSPIYRSSGICVPLTGWHNGLLDGKTRPILEGIALDDFHGGVDLMAQMARTLAENPMLYNTIGRHDVTPEHVALEGRLNKMLDGYARDGLVKRKG